MKIVCVLFRKLSINGEESRRYWREPHGLTAEKI